MIHPANKKKKSACVVPTILPTTYVATEICYTKNVSAQFSLFDGHFGQLASQEILETLKPFCLTIDIAEELALLEKDSALEIMVPTVGLTDLLHTKAFSTHRYFASPLSINGFIAKDKVNQQDNFPMPDFVLITDLAGNQYEIIVNRDGTFELPQEGTGLFSLATAITFIYSHRQVCEGAGLQPTHAGLKNKLVLLAPEANFESFNVRVCVTHINERHQRIVDTIRTINVDYPSVSKKHYQTNVVVQREEELAGDKLNISLSLSLLLPVIKHFPFSASVALNQLPEVAYQLHTTLDEVKRPQIAKGWLQHPIQPNIFTKHFGLSEQTLVWLIRQLYSEFDFVQDFLKGSLFGLKTQNGFNNFHLIKEALGNFYDALVHDLAHQKISAQFLFDRIPQDRILELDTQDFPVDFHDSIVLSYIQAELQENTMETLKKLFIDENDKPYPSIIETFTIYATGLSGVLPQVAVDIAPQGKVSSQAKEKDEAHPPKRQNAWTPLMTSMNEKPISFHVTQVNGEQFEPNSHGQVNPFTVVEIDPSRINTR